LLLPDVAAIVAAEVPSSRCGGFVSAEPSTLAAKLLPTLLLGRGLEVMTPKRQEEGVLKTEVGC
jgi:hypothetical protein